MNKPKLINGIVAILAVVSFSLSAAASADSGAELKGKSEKVSYADLDLQKQAGAEQLYRRLQQASKRVCDVQPLKITGSVKLLSQSMRCYHKTLDATVAKLNNLALTEIHEG